MRRRSLACCSPPWRRAPATSSSAQRRHCAPRCCSAARISCGIDRRRQEGSAMNRRDVLGLSAAAALLPFSTWAAAAEGGPARLIVVMLRGAVDGLNVVIPYREPSYREMRPTIAVAPPGEAEGAHDLDGQFGLHPALAALMPLWQAKQ